MRTNRSLRKLLAERSRIIQFVHIKAKNPRAHQDFCACTFANLPEGVTPGSLFFSEFTASFEPYRGSCLASFAAVSYARA